MRQAKTYHKKGQACSGDGCDALISVYNPATLCARCWAKVPLSQRPYKYSDGF